MGLGELRSPAVRNLLSLLLLLFVVAVLSWRCCGVVETGTIMPLTEESCLIFMVTCVEWRLWWGCGCREAALAIRGVGRKSRVGFWSMMLLAFVCFLIATVLASVILLCGAILCEVACAVSP